MYLVMRTSPLAEWCDWANYAYLQVTPELIEKYDRLMALAKELKEKEPSFYAFKCWDYDLTFLDTLEDTELQDLLDGDEEYAIIGTEPKGERTRMECEQLVLWTDDVFYKAIVKHTNIYVETPRIYAWCKEAVEFANADVPTVQ